MATVLSAVSSKGMNQSSINIKYNEPTKPKIDIQGTTKETTSGLKDDNCLEKVMPPKMKKICKKQRLKLPNSMFGQRSDIPVFSLPICKRTQTMIRLVNEGEIVATSYENDGISDSTKRKYVEKNVIEYPEPKCSEKPQKSLPKKSTANKKHETIDFSKYMVI